MAEEKQTENSLRDRDSNNWERKQVQK